MNYTDPQGHEFEDSPVKRELPQVMCKHCKTRDIISDGHEGWVHNDTFLYACDPRKIHTTFAEPRL